MFKKVLIAEDHEIANFSIQKTLAELGIVQDVKNYAYYCDDALARIQKAMRQSDPYELLITDLSFEDDHTQQKISSGVELIKAIKQIQPDLKILVFSIENRASIAHSLVKELDIDAYVPKARRDAQDLKLAIEAIYKDKKYLSPNLKQASKEQQDYKFTAFDITIISLISNGEPQKNIPIYLKENKITPAGLSSVEKRLNYIRTILNFSNNEQLVAYCKDRKII